MVQGKLTNSAVVVIAPMISRSCVTGEGMEILRELLVKAFECLMEHIHHLRRQGHQHKCGNTGRMKEGRMELLLVSFKNVHLIKLLDKSTHVAKKIFR